MICLVMMMIIGTEEMTGCDCHIASRLSEMGCL